MTLKNPSANFYDSDFDSQNESNIFDNTIDLNEAFIASPGKSITCILNDSSLSDPVGMLVFNDEKDHQKVENQKVYKLEGLTDRVDLSCHANYLKATEEASRNGSSLDPYSTTNLRYLKKNEQTLSSTAKRYWMPRLGELDSETGNIQSSDLLNKEEERVECIFTSTCRHEFQKTSEEYDWRKIEKRSVFEMDDDSEEMEPRITSPVSGSDYVYHELSTIPEVDSAYMNDSVESLTKSNKCHTLFMHDPKSSVCLKTNDSKAVSNSPAYIMKVIQNEHIEKLLQEPGILEQSDLTLLSTDLDSFSMISVRSMKKGNCQSYNKIKRFSDEISPSLISFEQHELSCMND